MQNRVLEDQKEDPVILAAKNGQLEHLKALIAAGADVNKQDSDGYSPLMWAIGNIKLDCAEVLIQAKASLELQDAEGGTALSIAAYASTQSCYDALGILLAAGANFHHRNKQNQTPIEYALSRNARITDVIGLLLNENAIVSDPVKMLTYLQAQDKSKLITYICFNLFYQQQDNLRSEHISNSLVLSDENFKILNDEIDALPKPPSAEWNSKVNLMKSAMDVGTASKFPTVLVDLISQYDNPYQRFGIFKYQKATIVPENKFEQLVPQFTK